MATPDLRARYRGCLLGLAAGDALGTTVEFAPGGTFQPLEDMVAADRSVWSRASGRTTRPSRSASPRACSAGTAMIQWISCARTSAGTGTGI
jgi:hypothetical protein